jgi:hypothetical protein
MNERIKELAEQAGMVIVNDQFSTYGKFAEKFAELIVKECMLINRQRLFSDCEGDTHRVAHNNALWCSLSDMQEHFGVDS